MNQSLDEALELATIQKFLVNMLGVEAAEASVEAFDAVSAA
jgi:hypothetical protein